MSAMPVAVVIAETLAQARDAAEKVKVDYEVLPAVADPAKAQARRAADPRGRAEQHDLPVASRRRQGGRRGLQAAPSTSPSSTSSTTGWCRTRWSRAPRSAEYDAGTEHFTLWNTSQNPHVARLVISAFVGMAPEHKLRVIAPDVGGGFGSKIFIYPEEVVCLWAAQQGRPAGEMDVRTAREAFLADAHGRDHVTHAEMAFDADGKILALRAKTIANLGAYMSTFSSSVPTYLYAHAAVGPVRHPARSIARSMRSTPTPCRSTPIAAPGGPEATFVVERLVEVGARELGIDPADLRKQNFIKTFPHQTPVIMTYDAGDYNASLKKALEIADVKGFGKRKREAARHGKLRGLGYSTYIEACGIAPSPGGRLARRRRRPVGIRRGAGQSDRHRSRCSPAATPRPGPRDDLRAAGVGAARHSDRERLDRARRHRQGAVRHGHLRLALRRGRHVGDRQGARQGRGQGQEGRRLHAGSGRRRHRVQGRQVHRRRHRQVGGLGRRRAQRLHRAQVHRRASSSRA